MSSVTAESGGHEAISETVRVEHGDADLSPSRARHRGRRRRRRRRPSRPRRRRRRGRPLRLRRLRRAGHARGWTLRKRRRRSSRFLSPATRSASTRRRLSPSALGNGPTSSSKVASHDFSDPSRSRSAAIRSPSGGCTLEPRRPVAGFRFDPADRRDSLEHHRRRDPRQPRPRRGRRPRTALVDRPRTP